MAPPGPLTPMGQWIARAARVPMTSWLALAAGSVGALLSAATSSGGDPATIAGGVLAFALPYAAIAVLLGGRAIWARTAGVALAALMTWLPSSGVQEFAGSLRGGGAPRPMALTFVALTIVGLAVVTLGLRDLVRAGRGAHYWSRTPAAARIAFLAVAYLALVFVADTYASANPSLPRMLMVPLLLVANVAAAYMLREPHPAARATGVVLAAAGALATAGYWAARPAYFTLVERPAVPGDFGYSTLLPWPVLLSLFLALETAVVVAGTRRLARERTTEPPLRD